MEKVKLVIEYSVDEEYYPDGKVRITIKEKQKIPISLERMLPPVNMFDSHIDHIIEEFKHQFKAFRVNN